MAVLRRPPLSRLILHGPDVGDQFLPCDFLTFELLKHLHRCFAHLGLTLFQRQLGDVARCVYCEAVFVDFALSHRNASAAYPAASFVYRRHTYLPCVSFPPHAFTDRGICFRLVRNNYAVYNLMITAGAESRQKFVLQGWDHMLSYPQTWGRGFRFRSRKSAPIIPTALPNPTPFTIKDPDRMRFLF